MMTSAFFSTLSFSAEQNCDQNNGAKRREDSNSLIMTISCYFGRAIPDVVCNRELLMWESSVARKLWSMREVVTGNGCIERLYGKLSGHCYGRLGGRFASA